VIFLWRGLFFQRAVCVVVSIFASLPPRPVSLIAAQFLTGIFDGAAITYELQKYSQRKNCFRKLNSYKIDVRSAHLEL